MIYTGSHFVSRLFKAVYLVYVIWEIDAAFYASVVQEMGV